jgi:hypothetical protein
MSTIKLFNKAFKGNDISFSELNNIAMKLGYLIHPDCCTIEVLNFLKEQPINYNSTFYKSWEDIISKNRFELYLDQIRHYSSTYGTDFQDEPWTPNNNIKTISFKDFKVINPITIEEVNKRCCKMLYSGIAINSETLLMIIPLITDIEISKIKNKESLMYFCKTTNTLPDNNVEFVRYLIYLATNKTLLIKDKETINTLNQSNLNITQMINSFGIEKVSEVFFRFKPIFLALEKGNESTINKLRKLANQYHKPMKIGYFEAILSDTSLINSLPEKLKECNNFKKIQLLQTISIRHKELDLKFFGIRNGKLWIKEEKSKYLQQYGMIYDIIYKSLINSLKSKATSIKIPQGINITLPISAKSFIGNYPLGTSFDLSDKDAIVGIHWDKNSGCNDLDLSLTDISGNKIGWNSNYKNDNNSIVYSGDVTSPNPEAVELMYASNGFKPSIVKVNLFSGDNNSKFKLFLATENIIDMKKNYMVNPNNILFSIDCVIDSKEKSVAVITENKLILAQFRTGNRIVSGDSITNKYIDYSLQTQDCYLDLKTVLNDAGFTINNNNELIDLTNLSKNTLIDLLS